MQPEFGVDDKIYASELYDAINKSDDDLSFYLELCQKHNGKVLELCCGTGRLTLPICKAGIDITGLDFTPSMLNKARQKSREQGISCTFIEGDMRSFDLDACFDVIFIPFNSLLNTYTFEDINSILLCIQKHLKKDGIFAFDIFHPNLEYLTRDEHFVEKVLDVTLKTGEQVHISQTMKYDKVHQVNRVKWYFDIDGKKYIERLDMRCFFPQEIDAILRYNNFSILHKFGDFDKNPFDEDSKTQVFVCQSRDTKTRK